MLFLVVMVSTNVKEQIEQEKLSVGLALGGEVTFNLPETCADDLVGAD